MSVHRFIFVAAVAVVATISFRMLVVAMVAVLGCQRVPSAKLVAKLGR